jgi:hypothetical protein
MARKKKRKALAATFNPPARETIRLAVMLLDTSDSDISAALVLHASAHYPQAVFLLQQAVEKAAKAYSLAIGIASWEELATCFSHDTLHLFARLAQFREKQSREDPQVRVVGGTRALDEIAACCRDPNALQQPIVEEWVSYLSQLHKDHIAYDAASEAKAVEDLAQTWLANTADPEAADRVRALAANAIRHISVSAYALPTLMVLGMVTLPHAVVTRYPDRNRSPGEVYKASYPLVRLFGDTCQVVHDLLPVLREWITVPGRLVTQQRQALQPSVPREEDPVEDAYHRGPPRSR